VDMDNGQIKVNFKEVLLWLKCVNNRFSEQKPCSFMKMKYKVEVQSSSQIREM
jgi:hypothetical protein